MVWDDAFKIMVPIAAAALGAIATSIVSAWSARLKVREVELAYAYKLKDSYISNARAVMGEVYIPISIEITRLSNAYEKLSVMDQEKQRSEYEYNVKEFEASCTSFLIFIDKLLSKGADAYLTVNLDTQLNSFVNFIKLSFNRTTVRRHKVMSVSSPFLFPIGIGQKLSFSSETTVSKVFRLPQMSISSLWIGVAYVETVVAAPLTSSEFEVRFRNDVPLLKSLIKEVVLGERI